MESKSADHETKAERLKLVEFAPCGDCSTEDLPQALCHLHFFKMDQLEQLIRRVSEDNLSSGCQPHLILRITNI